MTDAEKDGRQFLRHCLEISNRNLDLKGLLNEYSNAIKSYTDCDAVAIKILDRKERIPCESHRGFSPALCELESNLIIGKPECMCAVDACLICGDRGYGSVALIPIKLGKRIIGLIHVADHSPNKTSPVIIETLETAGIELGTAIRRIRAEERLAESEDRYLSLLHLGAEAGEAIVVLKDIGGQEGVQVVFNDAWVRLTGYSADELKEISFFDLLSADDKEASRNRHRRKMAGDALPGLFELSIVKKDGSSVPIELTGGLTSLKKERANIVYIRDISRRRAYEAQLKESETRFRAIYQDSPIGIELYDSEERLILANTACLKLFGTTLDQVRGFRLFDDPNLPDDAKAMLRRGETIHFEVAFDFEKVKTLKLYRTKRSGMINIDVTITRLAIDQMGNHGYLVHIADITNQTQTQQALRESEQLYRTLFETTGTATHIVEGTGVISLVNKEWENIFGYTKEESQGLLRYTDLIAAKDLSMSEGYFSTRPENPERVPRTYECQIKDKAGTIKETLITVDMIPGTNRRIASILDVSGIKLTQRELARSESRLRLLSHRLLRVQEEERTRIARDLHDQLAQELAVVKILTESLVPKLENPSLSVKARQLSELADRLIQTAHSLSINLRPEMLDKLGLVKAIQWYAEDCERHAGLSLPVDTLLNDNIPIPKDTSIAAYRIIQEAVTNVLRHARATQAKINLSLKSGTLIINVTDDGCGVDMARLNDELSLGLIGMRERASAVGGRCRIFSRPGRGTRVNARFPLGSKIPTTGGRHD